MRRAAPTRRTRRRTCRCPPVSRTRRREPAAGASIHADRLERDVAVLSLWSPNLLVSGHAQRGDERATRLPRLDHVVDVAPFGRVVRVGELLPVLLDQLF